jgi:hypothetical protein
VDVGDIVYEKGYAHLRACLRWVFSETARFATKSRRIFETSGGSRHRASSSRTGFRSGSSPSPEAGPTPKSQPGTEARGGPGHSAQWKPDNGAGGRTAAEGPPIRLPFSGLLRYGYTCPFRQRFSCAWADGTACLADVLAMPPGCCRPLATLAPATTPVPRRTPAPSARAEVERIVLVLASGDSRPGEALTPAGPATASAPAPIASMLCRRPCETA